MTTKNYINRIVLGTVQFGLNYGINNTTGKPSFTEITRILKSAEESGVETLDTAKAYGDSEKVIGRFLKENKSVNYQVISKLPKGVKPSEVDQLVCDSAENIGQPLHSVLFHDIKDFQGNPKSFMRVLNKKKQDGTIGSVGFSLYDISQALWLLEQNYPVEMLQFPYSILNRSFEPFISEFKSRFGTIIHTRSVFLQGLYFKEPASLSGSFEVFQKPLTLMIDHCILHQQDYLSFLLAMVLKNPKIDGVLVGVEQLSQLIEITNAVQKVMDVNTDFEYNLGDHPMLNPSNWP